MARRRGKPGKWLATDDYSGATVYANTLKRDYWGNRSAKPILKRNLQEIASPLDDPRPVPFYIGSQYEQTNECMFETTPQYIGTTLIPFPPSQFFPPFGFNPGIGEATIGCLFTVT